MVYTYLCSLIGREGTCFPTQAQIAQELGISSLDTIAKSIKKLTQYGFMIRNAQLINGFQRTVFQKPAPEFTLIRLLDAKAIGYDLFPIEMDSNSSFLDDLDTTESAVEIGLINLLGMEAITSYNRKISGLRGLLASRFFQRTGYSYEEAWATLQRGDTDPVMPDNLKRTIINRDLRYKPKGINPEDL